MSGPGLGLGPHGAKSREDSGMTSHRTGGFNEPFGPEPRRYANRLEFSRGLARWKKKGIVGSQCMMRHQDGALLWSSLWWLI